MSKPCLFLVALFVFGLGLDSPLCAAPARNPILWADVPDLAMIRVGDTYYMSSTTAHMSPHVPIMKSKDLVNWQLIGYPTETIGDDDALNLKNGKNAYSGGSWASSLRYHGGTFYLTTFAGTTGKTYVYKTKDIEKGPWTAASFTPKLHDHSLFFDDDGRVYMIYNGGEIKLIELTADATAIKPGGVNQTIIPNASLAAGPKIGLPSEGNQMLKHDGKYYLFNITWPRGGMRTETVHRADKLTGPYEGRIFLQDQGVAQGSLIDTPEGKWYAYLFQDHGAVGRVPFLVPVKWEDGWPVAGDQGKVPEALDIPAGAGGFSNILISDEFDRHPGQRQLPLAWQWNHSPDPQNWSLAQRPGVLRLTTGRMDPEFTQVRNMLTQRTFGPESSVTTALDTANLKDGDCAGLTVFQKKYGYVGVKRVGDAKSLVMVSAASDAPREIGSVPLRQGTVFLRIDCEFKDRIDLAHFYYSLDGTEWKSIGEPLHMVYTIPQFIGYRFGLFNFAVKAAGGSADFDFFRVSDKIMVAN